jgi:hypothetical protein
MDSRRRRIDIKMPPSVRRRIKTYMKLEQLLGIIFVVLGVLDIIEYSQRQRKGEVTDHKIPTREILILDYILLLFGGIILTVVGMLMAFRIIIPGSTMCGSLGILFGVTGMYSYYRSLPHPNTVIQTDDVTSSDYLKSINDFRGLFGAGVGIILGIYLLIWGNF